LQNGQRKFDQEHPNQKLEIQVEKDRTIENEPEVDHVTGRETDREEAHDHDHVTDRENAIAHLLEEDHVKTIAVVTIIKTDDHDHATGGDREKKNKRMKNCPFFEFCNILVELFIYDSYL